MNIEGCVGWHGISEENDVPSRIEEEQHIMGGEQRKRGIEVGVGSGRSTIT